MPNAIDPFPYFPEAGTGGYIYIGAVNQNAQTNPITAYRDAALTIPWAQPIRTVNGYPAYQGAKAEIFPGVSSWSITVKNSNGETVTNDTNTSGFASYAEIEPGIWKAGRQTPIAASKAQVQWVRDQAGAVYPPENMGGLWSDRVYYGHAVNAEFDATNAPVTTPLSSPASTFLATAHNRGSDAIVIPMQCIAGVHVNGKEAANLNTITYCDAGLTNVKLKGPEIDLQPGAGATISEAFGLAINAFTMQIPGPAIYIEGVFGGSWATGINVGNLSSIGAGLSPAPGTPSMGTLIDTGTANYAIAAFQISNTHRMRWRTTSGNPAQFYVDASNFFRLVAPTGGFVIRDNADAASLISFSNSGNMFLEAGGTLQFTAAVSSATATAGAATLPANPVGFLTVTIAGTNRKIPYYAI